MSDLTFLRIVEDEDAYPTALYLDGNGEVGTHQILTEAIQAACARLKRKSRRKLNRWVERLFLSSDKPLGDLLAMSTQAIRTWFELFLLKIQARCTLTPISQTAGDMVEIKRGAKDVSELRVAVTGLARIWQILAERGLRTGDNPFKVDNWSTMPPEERKDIARTWGSRFNPASYEGIRYAFKGAKAFKARGLETAGLLVAVLQAGAAANWPPEIMAMIALIGDSGCRISEACALNVYNWFQKRSGFGQTLGAINKGSGEAIVKKLYISRQTVALIKALFRGDRPDGLTMGAIRDLARTQKGRDYLKTIPLFPMASGAFYTEANVRNTYFNPAMDAAGLTAFDDEGNALPVRPHFLRHARFIALLEQLSAKALNDRVFEAGLIRIANIMRCTVLNIYRYAARFFEQRDAAFAFDALEAEHRSVVALSTHPDYQLHAPPQDEVEREQAAHADDFSMAA